MTTDGTDLDVSKPSREARGVLDWFWRGKSLRQARDVIRAESPLQQQRLRHAVAASELACRVVEGVDPLRAEPAYWLATSIYRDAAYWALLANDESCTARDLASAFAQSPRSLLAFAAGGDDRLAGIQSLLLDKVSVDAADEVTSTQRDDAVAARAFVEALIQARFRATEQVGRVLIQRWLRTGSVVVALSSVLVLASILIPQMTRRPDLARGMPWRTSSTMGECRPAERTCLGARTNILFHTTVEKDPWFETDLGDIRSFSVVEVENRGDCCPDAALPLVIQVSEDAQQWREVARRTEAFDVWRAELPPQRARYVRLQTLRRTALHLVRVSVYER